MGAEDGRLDRAGAQARPAAAATCGRTRRPSRPTASRSPSCSIAGAAWCSRAPTDPAARLLVQVAAGALGVELGARRSAHSLRGTRLGPARRESWIWETTVAGERPAAAVAGAKRPLDARRALLRVRAPERVRGAVRRVRGPRAGPGCPGRARSPSGSRAVPRASSRWARPRRRRAASRSERTERGSCSATTAVSAAFREPSSVEPRSRYVDVSRDGEWLAWVSYPEGVLWRSSCGRQRSSSSRALRSRPVCHGGRRTGSGSPSPGPWRANGGALRLVTCRRVARSRVLASARSARTRTSGTCAGCPTAAPSSSVHLRLEPAGLFRCDVGTRAGRQWLPVARTSRTRSAARQGHAAGHDPDPTHGSYFDSFAVFRPDRRTSERSASSRSQLPELDARRAAPSAA